MFEPLMLVAIAALGLVAGVLGGLLGIGGSTIMIPGLVLLFGQGMELNQHLYQAAAMIVNVAVAAAATARHQQAGTIVPLVLKRMLPATVAAILIGVWVSNLPFFSQGDGPVLLGRVMAVFLVYVASINIRRMFEPSESRQVPPLELSRATRPRCAFVGSAMGLVAGLLGVGGGAVAVPLQQVTLRLRLRNCIANSAAVMVFSAVIGAAYKNATLSQHGLEVTDSLLLAGLLIPTALAGGLLGGQLTYLLPTRAVRGVLIVILLAAAWRMAGF